LKGKDMKTILTDFVVFAFMKYSFLIWFRRQEPKLDSYEHSELWRSESNNHRTVWVERDLERSSSSIPLQ